MKRKLCLALFLFLFSLVFILISLPIAKAATETLRPNAAGDLTQLLSQYPSSGEHWDKVDEVTSDDDSTYIQGGSSGVNVALTSVVIKENGVTTTKPDIHWSTTSSYVSRSFQWTTKPSNGQPWTWTDIDNLQIGVYDHYPGNLIDLFNLPAHSGSGTINSVIVYSVTKYYWGGSAAWFRVTQVYAEVDYTATTTASISNCAELNQAGTTYTLTADIINSASSTCMDITANNIVLDCQGHTIDASGTVSNTHGISISRGTATNTNITVRNCIVTDWSNGIYFALSYNNIITNNTANNNWDGIDFVSSGNSIITNNTANNNHFFGIWLYYSSNNILRNNSIQSSHTSSSRQQGLFVQGSDISNFRHNIDGSNKINGLPIYYIDGINRPCVNNVVYTNGSSYGYMGFVGCNNITVRYSSPTDHILLAGTTNSKLSGLNISYTQYAISVVAEANNNTLTNNTANYNGDGIYLVTNSNNIITNNTLNHNTCGINLFLLSINNIITNNTANSNFDSGIRIAGWSISNIITNNTANYNSNYGIYLGASSSNILTNNTANSNRYGICLFQAPTTTP